MLDRLKSRIRENIKKSREESRKAKEAEKKLRLTEEKLEAQKYIRRAKRAGVDLSEDEALALVRKKKKGNVVERLQKASRVAEAFAEEFAGPLYTKPKRKEGKQKKKKRDPFEHFWDLLR